jgi:hypothetical protein
LLSVIDNLLGDDLGYIDLDMARVATLADVKNPVKVLRDKVVKEEHKLSGDGFVYCSEKNFMLGCVKDDPYLNSSPVHYYCARVFKADERAPLAPSLRYSSRMRTHQVSAKFILSRVGESFTADDLRAVLELAPDDDGLKHANNELSFFTGKMDISDNPPEGWRRWGFVVGNDLYYIQQTLTTAAKRRSSRNARLSNQRGRAIPSEWITTRESPIEIDFDTSANATAGSRPR